MARQMVKGSLLAKLDLRHAYRVVPVPQAYWHLVGVQWQRKIYLDTCVLCDLRSAPKSYLLWPMTCLLQA